MEILIRPCSRITRTWKEWNERGVPRAWSASERHESEVDVTLGSADKSLLL
jgi:hypothetical protein